MAYKFQLGDARLSGSLIQEGSIQSSGGITPLNADGAALGSATKEWADLYLADGGRILFGNEQDTWITQTGGGFRIEGGSETSGQPVLSLVNRGDFGSGPGLNLVIDNGAGESDGDIMGFINFFGDDSSDAQVKYARLEVQSVDVTNGTEDGAFFFKAINAGSVDSTLMDINSTIAGGVSVANDLQVGDDLYLKSDDAVIHFGLHSDITLDHRPDAGLRIQQNSNTAGEPVLSLLNTGDFTTGPGIHFAMDNSSGEGDGDVLGFMKFFGADSGNSMIAYSTIEAESVDVTNGTEDGGIVFKTLVGGSNTTLLDINKNLAGGVHVANGLNIQGHNGSSDGLRLGGTLVSATAAEFNLLDGGTAVGSSIALADSDGIIVDDGGVMKKIPASDIKTFLADNSMNVALKDNGNTLVNGINYFADLDGNEAANLPASPDVGDAVYVKAPNNCSSSSTLTINKQGSHTIDGLTSIILESPNAAVMLVYVTTNTWKVF